jgi:hypothetical protein
LSDSIITADYHLTPRGWEPGYPSPDRVETWTRTASQASNWSKEYIGWLCIWADTNVPRAERDWLREKHQNFMGRGGRVGNRITKIGEAL